MVWSDDVEACHSEDHHSTRSLTGGVRELTNEIIESKMPDDLGSMPMIREPD